MFSCRSPFRSRCDMRRSATAFPPVSPDPAARGTLPAMSDLTEPVRASVLSLNIDRVRAVDLLQAKSLVPTDTLCLFASGSLIRGWGNASSDLDLYVVADSQPSSATGRTYQVSVLPPKIRTNHLIEGGRVWDIEYWTVGQVDQLLGMLSWEAYRSANGRPLDIGDNDVDFVARLAHGLALDGVDAFEALHGRLDQSAARFVLPTRALDEYDKYALDVQGQIDAGDLPSAVLATRVALACMTEAVLAYHGDFTVSPKWRARQMREVDPPELPFDEWWRAETMVSFARLQEVGWVTETLHLCQRAVERLSLPA